MFSNRVSIILDRGIIGIMSQLEFDKETANIVHFYATQTTVFLLQVTAIKM